MGLFGRSHYDDHREYSHHRRHHRKDRDRVAGGYKAALANPNTTKEGRQHAKYELERMGRGREAHVPLMTKIKRALGIRSTPRSKRRHEHYERSSHHRRREYH
ncbi:uncharacterized protein STEHIDRAFT_167684 [Stereum hirsutum FP-91666 SS1]|uniref:uncharacterized protein n=1 Tax=Stereum hirsutum (strain FP-91666) TaxID=721885 RepID=UPI000440D962|nr:uncharacterized protein STEHIDRAFT_167684 [Stereum hirsutum FP-91666 SS1]EIM88381.1 hypothetical protein STEHIDRAFT_167684 [Stereum hirsutum FP-91666 SS1]